jgi:uncharacterized DUF497 family protein
LYYAYDVYIIVCVRFQYDPTKAAENLKKHGVSFADAEGVLQDPLAATVEDPDAKRERRFIGIGLGSAGELLVVVWADHGEDARLISARRATRKERKDYEG